MPMFRFDAANIFCLREMIDFQQAVLNFVLAYDVMAAIHGSQEWASGELALIVKLRDESRSIALC